MAAHILIIEDNADNLKLMNYLLGSFGHTVLTAGDGAEGLQTALRETPDLIICDIQLPSVDGYAVAQEIKRTAVLSRIPLVAVTALAMVGDRDKVMMAGFDGYITKPIVPRTFVGQVEAFLPRGLHGQRQRPHQTAGTTPHPSVRQRTLLVVEDSSETAALARKQLERAGYVVKFTGSVHEALTLARQSVPDLILCDLHTSPMDGLGLLRVVKQDALLSQIPFILISPGTEENCHQESLALTATKILVRPVEPGTLLDAVAGCLGTRKEV